ncbi:hypothetical protein [Phaeocystidibacter luteus]|uniref:Uncharacterized protein n=1 Tax=Phaeocystidibacter luteus TaxID=911197 RepID=A0A6N6RHN6_9FLAO|nr:hypothetical protein [Phaeocystidibacter luteus]KAB2809839.1 hypothetical protein F8C67_09815 [Phaeocystidibacter luteus]
MDNNLILPDVDITQFFEHDYFRPHRARRSIQREPGDIYCYGYTVKGIGRLDSIEIKVEELIRETSRIRAVIFDRTGTRLSCSSPHPITPNHSGEFYIPLSFYTHGTQELFIGIEFLELDRTPFHATSHQFRGQEGAVRTSRNTGVTLAGMELRENELLLLASWYNGRLKWQLLSKHNGHVTLVPYTSIHHSGDLEINQTKDEINAQYWSEEFESLPDSYFLPCK